MTQRAGRVYRSVWKRRQLRLLVVLGAAAVVVVTLGVVRVPSAFACIPDAPTNNTPGVLSGSGSPPIVSTTNGSWTPHCVPISYYRHKFHDAITDTGWQSSASYTTSISDRGYAMTAWVEACNSFDDCNEVQSSGSYYVKPVNTTAPSISSGAAAGVCSTSFSANHGTWSSGAPITGYNYQWWEGSTQVGSAATYTPSTPSEADQTVTLKVRAQTADGNSDWVSSSNSGSIHLPCSISLPSMSPSGHQDADSRVFTASPGSWTDSPTFSYQWSEGGVTVGTAATYTATCGSDDGKTLMLKVAATDSYGSSLFFASSNSATLDISCNTAAPTMSPSGAGQDPNGTVFSASHGTWSDSPTSYSYKWIEGASTIVGTASTYAASCSTDFGQTLTLQVAATNANGTSAYVAASNSATLNLPCDTAPPSISGTAQVGQILTASTGTWNGAAPLTYTYQWKVSPTGTGDWTDATGQGAHTSSYSVASADYNGYLRVAVTATNGVGPATANSAATAQVAGQAPSAGSVVVTGTARSGQVLTATASGFGLGTPAGQYVYKWYSCDHADDTPGDTAGPGICTNRVRTSSSTSSVTDTYTAVAGDVDKYVKVVATVSNSCASGCTPPASATSAATSVVQGVAPTAGTVTITGSVEAGQTLTATPSGFDLGAPTATYSYQWEYSRSPNGTYHNVPSGGTSPSFVVGVTYNGDYLKAVVTATNSCVSGCGSASAKSGKASDESAGGVKLPVFYDFGCQFRGEPGLADQSQGPLWVAKRFTIPAGEISQMVAAGYYLEAQVTNHEDPDPAANSMSVRTEAGSAGVFGSHHASGLQVVPLPTSGDAHVSFFLDDSGVGYVCVVNEIYVSFQWVFHPTPSIPRTFGSCNQGAPGIRYGDEAAGDPCDTESGAFSMVSRDAKVGTYGPPLSFIRSYDSGLAQRQTTAGTPGPLGYGWTDNWNTALTVSGGTVTINQGNGAVVTFQAPNGNGTCPAGTVGSGAPGTYCAYSYVTASLTYNSANSTYTFITHPYQSYTFNSSGRLISETARGGATLTLTYNSPSPGSGQCPSTAASCFTVTAASGRTLVIASNAAGFVTRVTDPLGHAWSYAYCSPPSSTCSSGDLVSVTWPGDNVTTFTYDEGNSVSTQIHDLLTVTRPNGQPGGPYAGHSLVNVYDGAGRVSSQTDPAGNQTTFDYSNLDSTGTGYTLVTDPDGITTQFVFNYRMLVGRTVGYGTDSPSIWTYRPDPSTLLPQAVIDPNGNETDYTYNSRGDLTSTTNALGAVWSYSYNSFDLPTCATLPQATSPCSSLSPPSAITPGGAVSPPAAAPPKDATYALYDTTGNLIWTTTGKYAPGSGTASQSQTRYALHNGESVTLGGTISCTTTAPSATLPCATINPNGVVTQRGYNGAGDPTALTTPDGNSGGEVAKTTYDYYGDGRLKTVVAPDGNLTGATPDDFTTTYAYTADGQLATTTLGHTGGSITARETQYGYDANGNLTTVENARSKATIYTYDADDQRTLVEDPDGQQTLTCYDGAGHVAETVPPVGVAANALTPGSCATSYPTGYGYRLASDATTYTYDALGDPIVTTTPAPAGLSGYETTTNSYDLAGELLTTTAPAAATGGGAPSRVIRYTYDTVGELLTVTREGSDSSAVSITSYCYDPDGNKTATVAPDGNTSSIPTCSTSAPYQTSSPYQTGYTYDSLGELASKTTPTTTFVTAPTTSYSYDPAGNQLTSQDPAGVTTTNTYTPLNRLASTSYSDGSTPAVSYVYDANGNRVSMVDGTGTSTYTYDIFNELTSRQDGSGRIVSYSYDPDGNTTGITYPLGAGATWAATATVTYGYDNADELNSAEDFNGNEITVDNTPDGLPATLTLGSSGDTLATTYAPTDTPSDVKLANSTSTTLQEFAYSDVPSGAVSSETDTPSRSSSYTYDAQNRVLSMTSPTASYGFDPSGNLSTLPTGTNSTTYDNGSELTASTLSGATTSYSYNADGEQTQQTVGGSTTVSASYNGAQELTGYANPVASMSTASYDGDSLRQSETATPGPENFTWDTRRAIPRLLLDSDNAYIYGPGNTPIEQVNLSTGTIKYLVSDRLGSVRGIVSSNGTLTATTSYDAWGNPQTSHGLTSYTPVGYAGAYTDPTGLLYLIRRYYDPSAGRFLTVDPLVDQTEAPYTYANDDPVNLTDPSGLSPVQDIKNAAAGWLDKYLPFRVFRTLLNIQVNECSRWYKTFDILHEIKDGYDHIRELGRYLRGE